MSDLPTSLGVPAIPLVPRSEVPDPVPGRERPVRATVESRRLSAGRHASARTEQLALAMQRRVQVALLGEREAIFEWTPQDDTTQCFHDGLIRIQCFHDGLGDAVTQLPATISPGQWLERVLAEDRAGTQTAWQAMFQSGKLDVRFRMQTDQPAPRWLRVRGRLVGATEERPSFFVGTIKDVSDQHEQDESLRLMALAFNSSPDAMVVADEDWQIISANRSFHNLVRIDPGPGQRASLKDFMDLDALIQGVDLRTQRLWRRESVLIDVMGAPIPVDVTVSTTQATVDRPPWHVVALRDITERKRAAARLEWFANYDPLTELLNRTSITDWLHRQLDGSGPTPPFALLFIDLDGFKEVNDSLGHNTGDLLLKEVANRIQETVGRAGLVARWGGDEFVVVLHPPTAGAEARQIAQRLVGALILPMEIEQQPVTITPSIGVALAPRDGTDAITLLRHADAAMYAAKDAGRNRTEFYRAELDAAAAQRLRLTMLLRAAVERNDFHFVAQRKVAVNGSTLGVELLIRWQEPTLGPVGPDIFVPLAEEIGVIGAIGRLAIDRAAALVGQFVARQLPWSVAVNLSGRQIVDPHLEFELVQVCVQHGIAPSLLELEVTESAFLGNLEAAKDVLWRLHRRGFVLALDDFGTGFSSLSYLRELPFDKVKIDRSFVRDIALDSRALALVEGVAAMCKTLGLAIVAEGVETDAQCQHLCAMGIDELQGYLLARPCELEALLEPGADAPIALPAPAEVPELPAVSFD